MMVENEASAAEPAAAATETPEKSLSEIQMEGFLAALKSDPKEAYGRWGLAQFHSLSDEEAQEQLGALKIDPSDALSCYNQGVILAGKEKYAEAAKSFAQALDLDPSLTEAVFNRALAEEKAGQTAEARKLWNQYLESCEDPEEASEIKNHITELANR